MDKENPIPETVEVDEPEAVEIPDEVETPVITEPEPEQEEVIAEVSEPETVEEVEPEEVKPEEAEETKETPEQDTEKVKELESVKEVLKKEQTKVEELKGQVTSLESIIASVVADKMKEIPKEFHMLIPEGSLESRFAWINKAEESGLFKKQVKSDVEIGKPLSLGNKNDKANANQTAQQKLSNYFSNFYSK